MTGKVLLVTNRRPDDPGGRAEKINTRVRLLSELGWQTVVGHVPEPYVFGSSKHLFSLVQQGRVAGVDSVLSINNPFHLHIHGFLTSSVLRIPWVAEFRDPILPRPDLERESLKWYPAAITEWIVVHSADRVLWFDGIQLADDYFETTYNTVNSEKFIGLPPIGYERPKFERISAAHYETPTISYAGSFYEDWIEPYDFIEALGCYLRESETEPSNIKIQFYGDWTDDYDRAIEANGVERAVETHDFIAHEEIVPVLKGSHAALYIGGDNPKNRRNIPSKIFDYIGAQTPILAIVDPSFRVADFIRNNDLGIVVTPGNTDAIAEAIATLVDGSFEYDPDTKVFEKYTRRRTAEDIAETLDEVTSDSTSPQYRGSQL